MVFPFFIYIMGLSCYLSFNKKRFNASKESLYHIAKRTVILFLAGLIINWTFLSMSESFTSIEHLRIWGPLQRIALTYLFVSLFAIFIKHKHTILAIVILLCSYTAILLLGNGYSCNSQDNILSIVDMQLFGYGHLYHLSPVDPEGLLGTISSVANALIGFYCGKVLSNKDKNEHKLIAMFLIGTVLLIGGYLLSYGLPINKKVWSPSFVILTAGIASLVLALLTYIFDIKKIPCSFSLFRAFGINALAIYVISNLLFALIIYLNVADWWYTVILSTIGSVKWSSVAFALSSLFVYSLIALFMYHKKLIIHL